MTLMRRGVKNEVKNHPLPPTFTLVIFSLTLPKPKHHNYYGQLNMTPFESSNPQLGLFVALMFLFQLKHFACDYIFQVHADAPKKGSPDLNVWLWPLSYHCLTHATATWLVVSAVQLLMVSDMSHPFLGATLAVMDFCLHFIVDRLKAHKKVGGRWSMEKKMFWVALGLDQYLHHVFNIVFGMIIVSVLYST